ncbi:hypothetical protein [Microvirga lenta]|uniref:hypothetical protein n=1 Tax=Microvirga lenta TaxID=2881337 RepID=UPI001CFFB732|nr:hypothetical protein [Microvirga lenta]MCB5177592.1 hypothetical protein [Microvirga lenta]
MDIAMPTETAVSADAPARADFTFKDCTCIAIRPTSEFGDRTLGATIDDYEEVQLQIGLPDVPTQAHQKLSDLAAAVDQALPIRAEHPHLRLRYNGEEIQAEFRDWRSFARMCAEWDGGWDLIERVAAGDLAYDDQQILDYEEDCPLLVIAAQKVRPS